MRKKLVHLIGIFSLLCSGAAAGEPTVARVQTVVRLKLDLKPSKFLPLHGDRARADVPMRVFTDSAGNLVAIGIAQDDTAMRYYDGGKLVGSHDIAPLVMPLKQLRTRNFTLTLKAGPLSRELFQINAPNLDPKKGGKISLSYAKSLIFGTQAPVTLVLRRFQGRWALVDEDFPSSPLAAATVNSNRMGTGLSDPELSWLTAKGISTALRPEPIANPAVADRMIKDGQNALKDAIGKPTKLAPGVSIALESTPAK